MFSYEVEYLQAYPEKIPIFSNDSAFYGYFCYVCFFIM